MAASRSTPRLRLTALLMLALLVLVAVSQRSGFTGAVGEVAALLGLLCVAGAALGRVWTSVFIAGFKDAQLVRRGPYAMLRHPLYALSMVAMLGLGLTTRSVAITLALLVIFGVLYASAARAEDAFLRGVHGAAFEAYAATVSAIVPRWSAYKVPETLDVRPRVLWKAVLDAGSLLGFWALLVCADALHEAAITPTWLTLP